MDKKIEVPREHNSHLIGIAISRTKYCSKEAKQSTRHPPKPISKRTNRETNKPTNLLTNRKGGRASRPLSTNITTHQQKNRYTNRVHGKHTSSRTWHSPLPAPPSSMLVCYSGSLSEMPAPNIEEGREGGERTRAEHPNQPMWHFDFNVHLRSPEMRAVSNDK